MSVRNHTLQLSIKGASNVRPTGTKTLAMRLFLFTQTEECFCFRTKSNTQTLSCELSSKQNSFMRLHLNNHNLFMLPQWHVRA